MSRRALHLPAWLGCLALVALVRAQEPTPAAAAAQEPVPAALSSRQLYYLGKRAATKAERLAHYRAGMAAAQALLARNADDPEGLQWLSANLGSEALARGKLAGLRALPRMEELLLRLDAVAPEHDGAAASRMLGHLYDTAPGLISIGSDRRARVFFEKALALAPGHPGNQALAAEFFQDEGERQRAVELARKVLENPDLGKYPEEAEEWRQTALRILEKDR
jgi:hypothetical protein